MSLYLLLILLDVWDPNFTCKYVLFWYECAEDTRSSIPFLRPLLSPRLEFCFSWKTAFEIAGVMLTRLSEINYFKAGPLMIDFFNSGRFLSLTQSNGFSTTKLRLCRHSNCLHAM